MFSVVKDAGHRYGMEDLIRDLDRAPASMETAKREAQIESARMVAERATQAARAQGSIARKAAPDIRVSDTEVVYGGSPWSMGAEFGAIRWKQFKPWRGNKDAAGYFLWPTVRELRDTALPKLWLDRYSKHSHIL
jgi:hypothetical protein